MIDLHCHILPAVDDDAEYVDVSVAMLDAARARQQRRSIRVPPGPSHPDAGTAAYGNPMRSPSESRYTADRDRPRSR